MKRYVSPKDLDLINFLLEKRADVKIIRTSDVVKILSCEPKVMQKRNIDEIPEYKEG